MLSPRVRHNSLEIISLNEHRGYILDIAGAAFSAGRGTGFGMHLLMTVSHLLLLYSKIRSAILEVTYIYTESFNLITMISFKSQ